MDVVYKAKIVSTNSLVNGKYYIGSACNFKERWSNHISTFRNRENNQVCALKDYIWGLKDQNIEFTIKWSIERNSKSYQPGDKACLLCLEEKLYILEKAKDTNLINQDVYTSGKCLHKNKFLINNWNIKCNTIPDVQTIDPRDAYINAPPGTQTQQLTELMLQVNVPNENTPVEAKRVCRERKSSTKYDPKYWIT